MTARAVTLVAALTVIVSVSYRLLYLNALLRPPFNIFGYSDLYVVFFLGPFRELHWPYFRFPFEYHPLIGWGSALLTLVTTDLVLLLLLWGLVMAGGGAGVAYLLTRSAPPRRALVFWAASPQLLVFGGLNFDTLAVLGLVAAAAAVRAGHPLRASAAIALGTAVKLFPIAALPLLALRERRRSIGRAVAVIAVGLAALAAVDGPAVLAPYSLLSYGHHPYHLASWNVDSIWLAFATVASLVTDLATIDRLVTVISAAGLIASYLWWCVRPAARGADPVPLFWRAVILILLWSRLYSPQYSLWVLPALVLFVPRLGIFMLLALGDLVTFGAIFTLGGGVGGPLGSERSMPLVALMLFGVLVRHAALVLLLRALLRVRWLDTASDAPCARRSSVAVAASSAPVTLG